MRGGAESGPGEDEDWQASLSAWTSSRRGSLQATGVVHKADLVDSVRADDAHAEMLRVTSEVRLRNRPLSERIRDRFRSLHDSDLSEEGDGEASRRWRRHTVEELLAVRATSAEIAACGGHLRLGLRLGVGGGNADDGSRPVRVTSVDLDSPADKSGLRPGDEILTVDGEPAEGECQAAVERSVAASVLADGVAHVRVRRRLPEPREPSAPPPPPLETLETAAAVVAAVATAATTGAGDELPSRRSARSNEPQFLTVPALDNYEEQLRHQQQHPQQQHLHQGKYLGRRSMPDIHSRGLVAELAKKKQCSEMSSGVWLAAPERNSSSRLSQGRSEELTSESSDDNYLQSPQVCPGQHGLRQEISSRQKVGAPGNPTVAVHQSRPSEAGSAASSKMQQPAGGTRPAMLVRDLRLRMAVAKATNSQGSTQELEF